ncbi:MAG: GGDEF domain-containing protein [Acidobacteria bacterium]|nr:GGDEF domain-containing protein [Acidobacteriota bacterium]
MTFVGVSLGAIIGAFVLASSSYEFDTKTKAFSAIIVVFLMYCAIALVGRDEISNSVNRRSEAQSSDLEVEGRLNSIEEAASYFGGSLRPADMFRLMSSRVRELVPFDMCALLMINYSEGRMRVVQTDGADARYLRGIETDINDGLAGSSLAASSVQIDRGTDGKRRTFTADVLNGYRSAAALPLTHNGEVFAVLELYSRSNTAFDGNSAGLLEAVSERIAPMILRSISFEQNLSKALTDPVTDLPNERAFYMIVENQLAESQRNRDGRPLSLLAVDIKNFANINERFGHAAGDRILNFVAQKIKEQLRQMDFFARSSNDEFLIILPTASEAVAAEIVARIYTEFAGCSYAVNEIQTVQIDLNFGASAFWKDGETAQSLLTVARERKEQSKTIVPSKVVWFPKEYIN